MTTCKRISLIALLSIAVAGVIAPSAHAAATRYITVSAQGTVKVVPDAVRINAIATSVAATSKEALAATAKTATAVRAALKTAKIDTKDIATQSVSVYPEYKYTNDGGSTLTGYRGSQSFTITVRAADTAGSLVDALVTAGGDNLQINGATPFVLDSSKSLEAARAAAVKSAKAKATSYAKLMGVKLGKVNYLVENSAPTNYTPVMAVAKAESDATVIDLGQQDVSISVTVQWSLL
ncbi:SIMPL domain-containing protein [Candidatus Planktophila dulcis]|uniref:SIMPL domain-containing protein n=1 Tax=Candidatus Planktophila dulcis TaxID=1884914 RepID=UPI003CF40D39